MRGYVRTLRPNAETRYSYPAQGWRAPGDVLAELEAENARLRRALGETPNPLREGSVDRLIELLQSENNRLRARLGEVN